MEKVYAFLVVGAMILPAVLLVLWGHGRGWPFRRYGPYILSYCGLLSLILAAAGGIRGWRLGIFVVVGVGVSAVPFYMYAYVLDEIVPRLKRSGKR